MTCLISGSGSGIGRAAALLIARRMPVIVADLNTQAAHETVHLIAKQTQSHPAVAVACDVRDPSACMRAVAAAEEVGPLTDLVSAAGVVSRDDGPLGACSHDTWDHVIAVNLTGAANLVRAALPAFGRNGGGDIVLVASIAALQGRAGVAAYSVSKAGLLGLQRSLVADYSAQGIRCNCVCPGTTATPMARTPSRPPANAQGRQAEPIEIAAAIDWLTAEESEWTIGAVLPLDAGESTVASGVFVSAR